jgi:hypothetical protein
MPKSEGKINFSHATEITDNWEENKNKSRENRQKRFELFKSQGLIEKRYGDNGEKIFSLQTTYLAVFLGIWLSAVKTFFSDFLKVTLESSEISRKNNFFFLFDHKVAKNLILQKIIWKKLNKHENFVKFHVWDMQHVTCYTFWRNVWFQFCSSANS